MNTKKVIKKWFYLVLVALVVFVGICFYQFRYKPSQTTEEILKNTTYNLSSVSDTSITQKEFTMKNGEATIGASTVCKTSHIVIDQNKKMGVAAVSCNYGASATDMFLVIFKNSNGNFIQTDATNLRNHPDIKSRGPLDLWKASIDRMSLGQSNLLKVNVLVAPSSQRELPGSEKYATEPITVSYQLSTEGKITAISK